MPTQYDHKLAQLAFRRGYAKQEEVQACGREMVRQEKAGKRFDLADIMVQAKLLNAQQVADLDAELERAGLPVPHFHAAIRALREREAASVSRLDLGEIPDEVFGGAVACVACGAIIAEDLIEAREGEPGNLCARCRAEEAGVGQVFQGFKVLAKIGAGRVGRVYQARDLNGRRDVALQIYPERLFLSAKAQDAFLKRLTALLSVEHPRLVRVLGMGRWGRGCYAAMERVATPTLRTLMDESAAASRKDRLARLYPALMNAVESVAALHDQEYAHGEIRPRKFFVAEDGMTKLSDGGLAASEYFSAEPGPADAYYAPTLPEGKALDDQAADAVAVARMAVEAVLGKRVEPGQAPDPAELDKLPRRVRGFVARALADDPAGWATSVPALRSEVRRLKGMA